jgi:hypothetical protein
MDCVSDATSVGAAIHMVRRYGGGMRHAAMQRDGATTVQRDGGTTGRWECGTAHHGTGVRRDPGTAPPSFPLTFL